MLKLQTNENATAAAQAAETSNAISTNTIVQEYLNDSNRNPIELRAAVFRQTADRMRRPCPSSGNTLPTALQISQHELRKLAIRWHLGSFPINAHMFQRVGLQFVMQDLKLLSKPALSSEEWGRLKVALESARAGEATVLTVTSYCNDSI